MDLLKNALFLLMLFSVVPAHAQLSPGPLHRSHEMLEGLKNCTKCHPAGKKLSADKCLACHSFIKTERLEKRGLHGQAEYAQCEQCHIEHQGENAELIWWKNGRQKFDHAQTGYKLLGAHKNLKCEQCHQAKNIVRAAELKEKKKDLSRTYLGLQRACLSCHADEHRGQFGKKDCLSCHTMNAWKPASNYDHQKSAFPLSGLHQKVTCEQCHRTETGQAQGKDKTFLRFKIKHFNRCTDCHQDIHKGKFGTNCTKCHSTNGWKKYNKKRFDHSLTDFPLKGKHQTVPCVSCHKSTKSVKIKQYSRCADCHQDYHQGQLASSKSHGRCKVCHNEEGFSPATFTLEDHQKLRFTLNGAHKALPCFACHKTIHTKRGETKLFRFKNLNCQSCHRDVHDGQAKTYLRKTSKLTGRIGCTFCHSEESWNLLFFNHATTDFPLTGEHKSVACRKCHTPDSKNIIRFDGLKTHCSGCHQDIHQSQFKQKDGLVHCENCHTPQNWKAEKFNHNRQARFKLTGAHQNVPCGKCHHEEKFGTKKTVRYKPINSGCETCHGKDKLK